MICFSIMHGDMIFYRVIGSSGELIGYGGGLERKKWLIEHEKSHSQNQTE